MLPSQADSLSQAGAARNLKGAHCFKRVLDTAPGRQQKSEVV
jgi:hypothetical protein